jgi:hypothetical protein
MILDILILTIKHFQDEQKNSSLKFQIFPDNYLYSGMHLNEIQNLQ